MPLISAYKAFNCMPNLVKIGYRQVGWVRPRWGEFGHLEFFLKNTLPVVKFVPRLATMLTKIVSDKKQVKIIWQTCKFNVHKWENSCVFNFLKEAKNLQNRAHGPTTSDSILLERSYKPFTLCMRAECRLSMNTDTEGELLSRDNI